MAKKSNDTVNKKRGGGLSRGEKPGTSPASTGREKEGTVPGKKKGLLSHVMKGESFCSIRKDS